MILLLGATGYIGDAFSRELKARGLPFQSISRSEMDYTSFPVLFNYLKEYKTDFLINAAGFTGKPNVDVCETQQADTLLGNVLLPQTISHACQTLNIPWGHVSSGCIYAGGKLKTQQGVTVEKNLMKPSLVEKITQDPNCLSGFDETDEPNFSFRDPPCSFYSGTKALAEEILKSDPLVYIWRLRIPFDEFDSPRNYLSKVQRYAKVYNNYNSISHRSDFAKACLDLWELKAAPGIYNVTNPGYCSTRQVVEKIKQILKLERTFDYWENDDEFYKTAAKTPRSNCIMSSSKLLKAGVHMRHVEVAMQESLENWNLS